MGNKEERRGSYERDRKRIQKEDQLFFARSK